MALHARAAPRYLAPGQPTLDLDEHATEEMAATYAMPFPYERKPQVPKRIHDVQRNASVPMSALIATQRGVTKRGVDKYLSKRTLARPIVYLAADGRAWIADGHHRAVAAWARGGDTLAARVVDVPDEYI